MLRLAFRNLFQNRVRFVLSAGGAALALVLILTLDSIFVGLERQITAYIDYSGADIIVSQLGIRNMHMASSTLPITIVDEISNVPGVEAAIPILYATNTVQLGEEQFVAYVIGVQPDAPMGQSWRTIRGASVPLAGQTIVDYGLATRAGLEVGDTVKTLGQEFTIGGLSDGTSNFMNTITFITLDDFMQIRGRTNAVSFVLVRVLPGETVSEVYTRIEQAIPSATVQLRQEFADEERQIVKDMSSDVVNIMNVIGSLIGLAVIALTTYLATLARHTEYGTLKALGTRNRDLYQVVLTQGVISVVAGLVLALLFTLLLAIVVPKLVPNMVMEISGLSLLRLSLVSLLIATLASILPIQQLVGLEPAVIVRGGK